jgi:hypothetical protein
MVWRLNPGRWRKFFSAPETPTPSLLFVGFWGYILLVILLLREVNHPPPPIAEVKNEWSHTRALPYAFTARTCKTLLLFCPSDLLYGNMRQKEKFTSFYLYKKLASLSLCVARIKPESTVTNVVLSPVSPWQNTNNRLVLTIRNTSSLSLKSGSYGLHTDILRQIWTTQ